MANKVPPVADLEPIYELPKISLAEKEKVLFDKIVEQHLNEQGCLLFDSYLPFSNLENYQRSHDVADFPAWHGHWMAALALKLAVKPSRVTENLLYKSARGLFVGFEATGILGLLPRSYIKHDPDKPLPWMKLEDSRPTMYWQQGKNGYWFRGGVSKDQYCGAILGLATITGLDKRGAITLNPTTRALTHKTLLHIAHYLVDNKYKIIDVDGDITEFGNLGGWYNGFNRLQILAMLRAGKTIGCKKCKKEYDRIVRFGAGRVVGITLGLMGNLYARLGRENAWGHYTDDQAIYSNAFAWFLNSDETDKRILKHIKTAMKGMWKFLRYSRKSYVTFIYEAATKRVSSKELGQAILTLKLFPDDKRKISHLIRSQTNEIQPICNQYISAHYWKSDYFRKATLSSNSKRTNVERAGQDYLSAYWIGRYFGLIDK